MASPPGAVGVAAPPVVGSAATERPSEGPAAPSVPGEALSGSRRRWPWRRSLTRSDNGRRAEAELSVLFFLDKFLKFFSDFCHRLF